MMPEERALQGMMEFLAESVLEIPETELFDLVEQEEGVTAPRLALSVREVLRGQVKIERQRALYDALTEYHRQVKAVREKRFVVPETPAGQRDLLASVFSRFPQMQSTFLTLQHREFKELSEGDVESLLKQLGALGVFDEEGQA